MQNAFPKVILLFRIGLYATDHRVDHSIFGSSWSIQDSVGPPSSRRRRHLGPVWDESSNFEMGWPTPGVVDKPIRKGIVFTRAFCIKSVTFFSGLEHLLSGVSGLLTPF